MAKVVVIGGGVSGCQAAMTAAKAGADVTLLERTDSLGGCALLAGDFRGNAEFTAIEELIAMGGGDIFEIMDASTIHHIEFPGEPLEAHISVYDVTTIESPIRKAVKNHDVEIRYRTRAIDCQMEGKKIKKVITDKGESIGGDVFIEAVGTTGPMEACQRYGVGCVLCNTMCPAFGSPEGIGSKIGIEETFRKREDGSIGVMGAGFNLAKESLSKELRKNLEATGFLLVPIPKEYVDYEKLKWIAVPQNVRKEFIENLCMCDNGFAKVRIQLFMPLEHLRSIKGLENARMIDPLAGGIGNNIRGLGILPTDPSLKVRGVDNLYSSGERAGSAGLGQAIVTGAIAGNNAVRSIFSLPALKIPATTVIGECLSFYHEGENYENFATQRYNVKIHPFFLRVKEKGLYLTNPAKIKERIRQEGLEDIFAKRLS